MRSTHNIISATPPRLPAYPTMFKARTGVTFWRALAVVSVALNLALMLVMVLG